MQKVAWHCLAEISEEEQSESCDDIDDFEKQIKIVDSSDHSIVFFQSIFQALRIQLASEQSTFNLNKSYKLGKNVIPGKASEIRRSPGNVRDGWQV